MIFIVIAFVAVAALAPLAGVDTRTPELLAHR